MKKIFLAVSVLLSTLLTNAQVSINKNFSKASALEDIMKRYTTNALPGVSVAVYTESEGWWTGSAGYSKVETKTPMTDTNLQYLQSVAKTYMAVAILKLHEEGKIDLDALITKYLPAKYARNFKSL